MKQLIVLCALIAIAVSSVSAQTATPRVTKRQVQQQARIREGVRSGELTPGETRRLERQQAKIAADKQKAKSDGVVTPKERAKLTHEQNKSSRRIARLKHNGRTAK